MILAKDKVFLEKRQSVIQHMQEGNHMFYSSMQELLKYVSTQFLRSIEIGDKYCKEKRDQILKEGGNALSTIKLVCTIMKQPSLFEAINMSLMNILANTSKHATLVFPYVEAYGEDIVEVYNEYIKHMWSAMGDDGIFSEIAYIEFSAVNKEDCDDDTEEPDTTLESCASSEVVDKYINGEIGDLVFRREYPNLSDKDKDKLMYYRVEQLEKQFSSENSRVWFEEMGGNEWFIATVEESYSSNKIYICLVKQNTNFIRIEYEWYRWANNRSWSTKKINRTETLDCVPLKCYELDLLRDYHFVGLWPIDPLDDERERNGKYFSGTGFERFDD